MRLPRVRFTVRRLMVVVAIIALGLGLWQSWRAYQAREARLRAARANPLARYGFIAHASRFEYEAGQVIPVGLKYDLQLHPALAGRFGPYHLLGVAWLEDRATGASAAEWPFDRVLSGAGRLTGGNTWRAEGLKPGEYVVCCKLDFREAAGKWRRKSGTRSMIIRVKPPAPSSIPEK